MFFYEKVLNAQKRTSNQNQQTKQKQANKKQQRQQFFTLKTFQEWENCYFAFLKKIEIALITSFTMLLD